MTTLHVRRATRALIARALLLALAAFSASACGSDLASVRCVSNSECASNRCLGGVCVPNDEDAGDRDVGSEDAATDDAGDGDVAEDVSVDVPADTDGADADADAGGADATDVASADASDVFDANDDAFDVSDEADAPGDDAGDASDVPDATDAADASDAADTADASDAPDTTDAADAIDAADTADASDAPDTTDAADASDASDATDAADAPDVDPELPTPTGLEATDGTFESRVRVTWDAVAEAEGYRLFRDGVELAELSATTFDDRLAAPGLPSAPRSLEATDDDPFQVLLTWEAPFEVSPGVAHEYRVAALRDGATSELSAPDEGFTAPSDVVSYDVQTDGDVRSTSVRMFGHGGAAAPELAIDRLTAERIGADVALNVIGLVRARGAASTYRVRAVTDAGGVGPWSGEVTGRRQAGLATFAWQRTDGDMDGGYMSFATGSVPMITDADALDVGQARYYRVVIAADGAADLVSDGVRVSRALEPPPAPTGVSATDGTSSTAVTITWSPVDGASSYDVYRDSTRIATELAGTEYVDAEAGQGGVLDGPPTISATDDMPGSVRVTWSAAPPGDDGPAHAYSVVARNAAGEGERSVADVGYRAAASPARYEIRVDGGPWGDVGNTTTYTDTDAPPGVISPGVAEASDGTSTLLVSLTLTGTELTDGAERTYVVRGVDTDGRTGGTSPTARGRRALSGSPRIVWERSSGDSPEGFADSLLRGATAGDLDAPADGSGRYYRAVVSLSGAADATSDPDRGFRATETGRLGATCAGPADCDSGVCSNGHCSIDGFSYIPAGAFTMGSTEAEPGRASGEGQHEVTLSHAFVMQQTEVTNEQWAGRMGTTPSYHTCGSNCPVERVNWWDAAAYANALSSFEGLTPCYTLSGCSGVGGGCASGDIFCQAVTCSGVSVNAAGGDPYLCEGYRLPTEAEWEYAARAGTTTATYNGDITATDCTDIVLPSIAWFCGNATAPQPVAGRAPNAWGLHDMLGNVYEWVWDWYRDELPDETDPLGASSGTQRMQRSAAVNRGAGFHRAAFRSRSEPRFRYLDTGFRVVRTVP